MSRKTLLGTLMVVLLVSVAGVALADRPTALVPDAAQLDLPTTVQTGAQLDGATAPIVRSPLDEALAQRVASVGECSTNCNCDWAICVGDEACCDEDLAACSSLRHLFCDPH